MLRMLSGQALPRSEGLGRLICGQALPLFCYPSIFYCRGVRPLAVALHTMHPEDRARRGETSGFLAWALPG